MHPHAIAQSQEAQPSWDVLGLGCTAVDDLLYVPEYPGADAKIRVRQRERQCGGLTATALVAAARLGARCAYAGTLGDDPDSRFVIGTFAAAGIDTSLMMRRPDARPIHSTIIVDEVRQTRNIFFDLAGSVGAETDWPPEDAIKRTRVLFVDHYGIEGMIRAARIARENDVAVVGDLERDEWPGFVDLLALVDHLIVNKAFARKLTGEADPDRAVVKLWKADRQVVIVTCGDEGCWYLGHQCGPSPRHMPAYSVNVVDTTGCGDVFHGAYAASLARDDGLEDRIRFASAAAALKATRRGAQAGIPDCATVQTLLNSRG